MANPTPDAGRLPIRTAKVDKPAEVAKADQSHRSAAEADVSPMTAGGADVSQMTAVETVAHATPSSTERSQGSQPQTRATTEQPAAVAHLAKDAERPGDDAYGGTGIVDLALDPAPAVTPIVLRSRPREIQAQPVGAAAGTAPPNRGATGDPAPETGPARNGPGAHPTHASVSGSATTAVYERVLHHHLAVAMEAALVRVLPAALEAAKAAVAAASERGPSVADATGSLGPPVAGNATSVGAT